MKLLTLLYVFCLFYVFIPGNVFKLPIKTSKMNIILIHALLFSVVLSYTYSLVENVRVLEGMSGAHTHDEKDIKKNESMEKDELNKEFDAEKKSAEEPKKLPPTPVQPNKPTEEPKKPLPQSKMMQM